ncbi:TetR/AcrR family transcriptional regulator [Actinomadura litoris]|uniref:TetR family transcriptional regulator n=1 Tax=Actinomadura litoris TaxID=2678616 RepID=A0A7K1L9N9_9ACTN|nr:TetR/AcrR family transcriptional regulator [Actinomadura litoris]MUN41132.1 TetR family transcriptional regulator [Actinomadura litoris]
MPKVVDHEGRRRAITAAACQVIAASGPAGATMRDIAAAAGCTTGMVTHYFRGKDEVLLAALNSVSRAVADRVAALAADPSTGIETLLCECLPMDDRRRLEWRVWIAFWGSAAHDPALAREQRDRYRTWREALQLVLATPGRPSGPPLEEAAETLMTAVDGIGIQAVFDPRRWPPERQARQMRRQVAHVLADLDAAPDPGVVP